MSCKESAMFCSILPKAPHIKENHSSLVILFLFKEPTYYWVVFISKEAFLFSRTFTMNYSVIHISTHPSKGLCSKMALGEVGVSLS